jgi:glycosyltransferase involved in cell wall biosynthesis
MISLVLATYNRYDELTIFLNSVLNSTIEFEIIIVDQNDYINIEPIILKYINIGLDIVHIKEIEKNLSKARNIGIALAKYNIIGFPDDDCYYEKDTLLNLSEFFTIKKTDILIGRWVENSYNYLDLSKAIELKDILNYRTCPLSSITLFATKSVLEDLNGFDILLGIGQWFGAGEEIDLIMRAGMSHFIIYFSPKIKIHHKFVINNIYDKLDKNKFLIRERGTGAIYLKNNIPIVIVIRGLFSPIFKSLFTFKYIASINYLYMFWGRLTGFIKWNKN